MPARFALTLTEDQERELTHARDHHALAYMRVKASAILKVAHGASIDWVAAHGLLKPVAWDTVKNWIVRYQQEGLDGLRVQVGRGRKPAFFPSAPRAGERGSGRALASCASGV